MAFRFKETLYLVDDLDAAIAFYTEKVGFCLENKYDWGFAVMAIDDGPVKLGLYDRKLWFNDFMNARECRGGVISLQVENLLAEHTALKERSVDVSDIAGEPGSYQACLAAYPAEDHWMFLWEDGS